MEKSRVQKDIDNLRRYERRAEQRQALLKARYLDSDEYRAELLRLKWHSRPDRNCPAWVQRLQRSTVEQFCREVAKGWIER